MADTKVSALTSASALAGTDVIYIVQGSNSRKVSLATLNQFFEPLSNAALTTQTPTAATDTYLAGSSVTIPTSRMQAGVQYRLRMICSKTAAGTAAPIFTVRYGTNASTADTARCTLTMGAQAATANTGVLLELLCTFRSYSSTGVLQAGIGGAPTGFPTNGAVATSAGFDMTVANSIIGVSLNTGASAAWTITQVQADMLNIL